MNSPEVKTKAQNIGFLASTTTPEELAEMIKRDVAITERIVKAARIEPE
jgi:tripartite-type tricarboxylate transporter receptor subunit TctC